MEQQPKVFISYSWEDDAHKEWVKSFADSLLSDGIDATIDQYDLELGDRLPHFMEQSIADSDYVLVICTPTYKKKSDARKGGVGYEGHIISGELFSKGNERKFIPVIRKGNASDAIPTSLSSKLGINLTDGKHYNENYQDLITTLFGVKKKPQIGNRPSYVKNTQLKTTHSNDEPIKILGIITDEVTVPKMDGSRGCALYKIPFRLSKTPSSLWRDLFVSVWRSPPRFTSMHRFNIASVVGDKIILDGTTIEEVRDYHRETLIMCVEIANERENAILEQERIKKERENTRITKHYSYVNDIADEIEF